MKKRDLVKTIAYVLIVVLVLFVVHFIFFTRTGIRITHTNVKQLSILLMSFGVYSKILGVLAIFIQTFIPFVPFMVIAGANVIVFGGLWEGFAVNYCAACLSAFAAFLFARYLVHHAVEQRISKYPVILNFNKKLESHGFFYTLFGRMIPFIPSSAINLGGGVSRMKFWHFLLGTLLGKLPIVFLESMMGHDLLHFGKYRGRLLLLISIFVVLFILGSIIKKRLTRSKEEEYS